MYLAIACYCQSCQSLTSAKHRYTVTIGIHWTRGAIHATLAQRQLKKAGLACGASYRGLPVAGENAWRRVFFSLQAVPDGVDGYINRPNTRGSLWADICRQTRELTLTHALYACTYARGLTWATMYGA